VELIKDHEIFKGGKKKKQAHVEHQLMTLLCFLGTEGNGMSNQKGRSLFHIGKGTVGIYKDRVVKAIIDCLYQKMLNGLIQKSEGLLLNGSGKETSACPTASLSLMEHVCPWLFSP
jgi:hypothetical protein